MSILTINIIIFVETFVKTFVEIFDETFSILLLLEVHIEPARECTRVDSTQKPIINLKNLL
jgi:hypothetical protein